MKTKKLISLLCAAAMTVSSFAGLTITASAASEPVWEWDGGTELTGIKGQEIGRDTEGKFLQISGTNFDQSFTLPTEAQLSDDYVIDFDAYVKPTNGQGRLARYTQLVFIGATLTKDDQNYGGAYATEVNTALGEGETGKFYLEGGTEPTNAFNSDENDANNVGIGYKNGLASITARCELLGNYVLGYKGDAPNFTTDGDCESDGQWARFRVAVSGDTATYTAINANGDKLTNAVAKTVTANTKLTQLKLVAGKADGHFFSDKLPASKEAVFQLDNIKIYSGVANAPELDTKGLRSEVRTIQYGNVEEYAGAAPKLVAPEGIENVKSIDFNGDSSDVSLTMPDVPKDTTPDPNLVKAELADGAASITIGSRVGGDNSTKAAVIDVVGGTKAVKLTGGQYATGGRSAMFHVTDTLPTTDKTSVMAFSVFLSKASAAGTPKLWLVDDKDGALTNDSSGADAYYSGVFGVLTNGTIGDNYKFGGNFNRGIQLSADEWHTVVVAVTGGDKYRIFVDGNYQDPDKSDGILAAVTADTLHYGGTAYKAANLPAIAIENAGTDKGSAYSTALIDNVITYTVDEINLDNLPEIKVVTPVIEATGYNAATQTLSLNVTNNDELDHDVPVTVVHASYNSDNTIRKVTSYNDILVRENDGTITGDVEIPAEDEVFKGDKLMVWNSLDGMKPLMATPYTVTEGANKPVEYSITVPPATNGTVTASKSKAEAGETVTLTVTPADGIPEEGSYEVDTVKVMNGTTEVAVTKTEDGKYTFTMPAANVIVTATFKPTVVELPELTGTTVTITGDVKVAETLTANVTGAPEGATLHYQWMIADTQNGEFTAVAGDAATRTIGANSAGKYEKVVVTADGYKGSVESPVVGPIQPATQQIVRYNITAAADPADTATITTKVDGEAATQAMAGVNVKVEAIPNAGYQIAEVTVDDNDTTVTKADDGSYTFVMPAKDVAVTVKTVQVYTITKATPENGTFNVSAESAAAGTTINITDITPTDGYEIDTVKYNDTVVEAADGAYSFVMPAANVTVTVTFKAIPVDNYNTYFVGAKDAPEKFTTAAGWKYGTEVSTNLGTDDGTYLKLLQGKTDNSSYTYPEDFTPVTDILGIEFDYKPVKGSFALRAHDSRGYNYWNKSINLATLTTTEIKDTNGEKVGDLSEDAYTNVKIYVDLKLGEITYIINNGTPAKRNIKGMATDGSTDIQAVIDFKSNNVVYPEQLKGIQFNHAAKANDSEAKITNVIIGDYKRTEALPTEKRTLTATATNGGSVDKASTQADYLEKVTVTATGDETHRFDNWTNAGGDVLATTAAITRRMYADEAITANFTQLYKIELTYALNSTPVSGLKVTVGETEKTTDAEGKVSFIVAPGEYTATTAAGDYKATTKTVTVSNANVTDTVALESNAQALAAMDIDSSAMNTGVLTTTAASKVVGKIATKQYANAEKTEPMVTPADVTWTTSNEGVAVATDGTVTITNAVAAGNYTITATSGEVTATYNLTVAATGTETVKAASEDFEGATNIFGFEANGIKLSSVWTSTLNGYKNIGVAGAATKADFASPVVIENGDTVVVSLNAFNGYVGDFNNIIALKDSQGNELFSSTYNLKSCSVSELKIGGAVPKLDSTETDFAAFGWQGGYNASGSANGFGGNGKPYRDVAGYVPKLTITITGNTLKAHFEVTNQKQGNRDVTYTGTITSTDIASIVASTTTDNADRALGIDNLVTTITRAE